MDGHPALCLQSPPFQSGPDLDTCKDASVPYPVCPALCFPPNLRDGPQLCRPPRLLGSGHASGGPGARSCPDAQAAGQVSSLRNSGAGQASQVFKAPQVGWTCCQAERPLPRHCHSPAATSKAHGSSQVHWVPAGSESAFRPGTDMHSVLKTLLDCMAVNSSVDTKSYRAPTLALRGHHARHRSSAQEQREPLRPRVRQPWAPAGLALQHQD